MAKLQFPRCNRSAFVEIERVKEDKKFFECQNCHHQYTLLPGTALTDRWGRAITLALYPLIFETDPVAIDPARIDQLFAGFPDLEQALVEIRLELESPTQQVRDTVDCVAPEAMLRKYLELFCERGDAFLARDRARQGRHPKQTENDCSG